MADYRSNFYGDNNMQIQPYYGPPSTTGTKDFRSYSDSYYTPPPPPPPPEKLERGKSAGGSGSKSWIFNDPELQRKKRIASYKVYSAEGKVKGSFRKSFRWLKNRYTQVVHGWW
ncbi:Protein of unknown function (DUF3511 [Striga hermonthica]|uniref:DUF3511 domain protein n=1 Tax=Striga hermonthica TaxID=68872 RepID=A0A9N7NW69_STRHE|nr:Protein of unknown function (DUF3511 [Striga hermonthica]